jgi:metal-dependent hydrolase (beta-lactamase superfamily II)
MSAWYESKKKNTEGNGANDKSLDGRTRKTVVFMAACGHRRIVTLLETLVQNALCLNIK